MSGLGILAGPGVVRAGAVDGLRSLARRTGCGVVNTWGAKGVLRWDDPLHFGTAGLQARDFDLAGLGDVDVLVTTGLDPAEVTSTPWDGRADVVDVPPSQLATFDRPLPPGRVDRPALYTELASVVGPLYGVPTSAPARAADLAARLADDGLVVAGPGLVGFWIARIFPTTRPGSVLVPATGDAGTAAALAGDLALHGRRVTFVTDSASVDAPAAVEVERWDPREVDLDPAPLIAVAGEIVAWGGRFT